MKNRYEALLVLNAQGKDDTIKDIVDRLDSFPTSRANSIPGIT